MSSSNTSSVVRPYLYFSARTGGGPIVQQNALFLVPADADGTRFRATQQKSDRQVLKAAVAELDCKPAHVHVNRHRPQFYEAIVPIRGPVQPQPRASAADWERGNSLPREVPGSRRWRPTRGEEAA